METNKYKRIDAGNILTKAISSIQIGLDSKVLTDEEMKELWHIEACIAELRDKLREDGNSSNEQKERTQS